MHVAIARATATGFILLLLHGLNTTFFLLLTITILLIRISIILVVLRLEVADSGDETIMGDVDRHLGLRQAVLGVKPLPLRIKASNPRTSLSRRSSLVLVSFFTFEGDEETEGDVDDLVHDGDFVLRVGDLHGEEGLHHLAHVRHRTVLVQHRLEREGEHALGLAGDGGAALGAGGGGHDGHHFEVEVLVVHAVACRRRHGVEDDVNVCVTMM
ncbi:unnamed protein product [Linum tenue]|uniref:Uncharacterized protein n=1 Tax=Linum tenue TaxID=586396 RepID=A0AAV0QCM1_9ROSI|nr:unnamed protein product [Linum tenue]